MEGQIETMFRTDAEAPPPEPVVEAIVETPETPVVEPIEPAQPEAPEQPSPEPVAVEPTKDDGQRTVPLPTFLDQRDELKAAKRRLAEFEARPQPGTPSPFDDPDAFGEHFQGQLNTALTSQRMAMSDVMARQSYGAETVEKAAEWASTKANEDPTFRASWAQTLQTNAHPIDWIVQQHKRDALLSDIGDSPDAWFEREAAKRGYAIQSAPVVAAQAAITPAPKPTAPPKSIAGDASPTSSAPVDPNAFWGFLDRK